MTLLSSRLSQRRIHGVFIFRRRLGTIDGNTQERRILERSFSRIFKKKKSLFSCINERRAGHPFFFLFFIWSPCYLFVFCYFLLIMFVKFPSSSSLIRATWRCGDAVCIMRTPWFHLGFWFASSPSSSSAGHQRPLVLKVIQKVLTKMR